MIQQRQKEYPHLFKQNTAEGTFPPPPPQEQSQMPDMIPVITSPVSSNTLILDEALVKKVGREVLLRLKAMEYVLQLVHGRTLSPDSFEKIFDKVYNKIKNGPTNQRPQIR